MWNLNLNVTGRLTGEIVTWPTQFLCFSALPISLPSYPCLSAVSFLKFCTSLSLSLSPWCSLFSVPGFSCLSPLASLGFHTGFLVISLSLCVSASVSLLQAYFFYLFIHMFIFNVSRSSCSLLLLSVLNIKRASEIPSVTNELTRDV